MGETRSFDLSSPSNRRVSAAAGFRHRVEDANRPAHSTSEAVSEPSANAKRTPSAMAFDKQTRQRVTLPRCSVQIDLVE